MLGDIWRNRSFLFGKVGVGFFIAASLAACNTVQLAPLDDSYYYPDKKAPAVEQTAQSENVDTSAKKTEVEYVNVQDTVVTIRVKR